MARRIVPVGETGQSTIVDEYMPGEEVGQLATGITGFNPTNTDIQHLLGGNMSEDIRPGVENLAQQGNLLAQVALANFLYKAGKTDSGAIPTLPNLPSPPSSTLYQGKIENTGPLVPPATPAPTFSSLFQQVMARLKEQGIDIEGDFIAQLELMARLLSKQNSGVERQ